MSGTPVIVTKTAKELIIDKINQVNNIVLDVNDFTFSNPSQHMPTAFVTENTSITITAKATSTYSGSRICYYNRMDLDQILDNPNIEITLVDETTLSELIPKINFLYGINLTSDDYVEQAIQGYDSNFPNRVLNVVVAAKSTSLMFTGSFRLELGPRLQQPDDTGVVRRYFALVQNLPNVTNSPGQPPNPNILSSVVAFRDNSLRVRGYEDTYAEEDGYFAEMRGVNDIDHYFVRKIYTTTNKRLILDGDFTFTAAIGNNIPTLRTSKTIILDEVGAVIGENAAAPFGGVHAKCIAEHPLVGNKYVVDQDNILGASAHKLYRYLDTGLIDYSFSTTLSYIPSVIALDKNAKLYTVSDVILDSGVKKIFIDRLLSTGAFDTTFNRVVFTSIDTTDPLPVVQVKPLDDGSFYIVLNPFYGVSTATRPPVINGVSVFTPGLSDHAYNPVFRFRPDGTWDTEFANKLLTNSGDSIYNSTGSNLTIRDSVLNVEANIVSFFTNKANPFTGYRHRMPISFDRYGNQIYLATDDYLRTFKWIDAKEIIPISNGGFISYGNVTLNTDDPMQNTTLCIVGKYKANGAVNETDSILFKNLRIGETLGQVVVSEYHT
jgi:hypothetical protein